MWEHDDIYELKQDLCSLIIHLNDSFKDSYWKLALIDSSDIQPLIGRSKLSSRWLPVETPPQLSKSPNPILLIYYYDYDDDRPTLFGIKIGRRVPGYQKYPIALISYNNDTSFFYAHFNVEARFFEILGTVNFITEEFQNLVIKDFFSYYIDYVQVSPNPLGNKLQKRDCFNFGEFRNEDELEKTLGFIHRKICKVSNNCLKEDYAFCLDLRTAYAPFIDEL